MDDINTNISKNLKQIRREKGLTLEGLSSGTGVSKSMLGEIERGTTNPTISVLWKIAEGLKMPLTRLFEDKGREYDHVKANQMKLMNDSNGCSIYSIFPYYDAHKSEMLNLVLQPGAVLSNIGHMNGIDEYIHVLKGQVKLVLHEEALLLSEGDSVRFNGALAHEFTNQEDEEAVLLNVLYYS
jgi:XRE family transcriptional regulator, regulator of sulfur utilization